VWLLRMAFPPAVFLLLRFDTSLDQLQEVPQVHFLMVSLAAIAGLILAWIVAGAARAHQDARVFAVALAFFGLAGIFLMHALSTQGTVAGLGLTGFIWSPPLSFLLGAVFFAASSVRFSDKANHLLLTNQNQLLTIFLGGLLLYAAVVALVPDMVVAGLGLSTGSSGDYSVSAEGGLASELLIGILVLSLAGYGYAATRYTAEYRRQPSVLIAALLSSIVLFAEANVFEALSQAWHLSWWLYHLIMVVAFAAAGFGILVEYGRRGSVTGLFGEVFLREELARLDQTYTDVIIALINSLEARDRYTKGHSARVAQYSVVIATALGYSQESINRVEHAALLHDIGKLAIPDAILNKTGPLTDEEFEIVKSHPVSGCAIIESIGSLSDKVPGIRHHHEWLDGSGYPDGLKGEDIPLDARVIAVADVFDAMTSLRSYRQPLSLAEGLAHLRHESGRHLDPLCVEVFCREVELLDDRDQGLGIRDQSSQDHPVPVAVSDPRD
jgi:HD-GYP domain-containing protein (c-di-GMP phosphodiesterase class II)